MKLLNAFKTSPNVVVFDFEILLNGVECKCHFASVGLFKKIYRINADHYDVYNVSVNINVTKPLRIDF